MSRNETINVSDIESIPSQRERDLLRKQGVKSVAAVPLFVGRAYYGFIGFDECRYQRE